ncbi:MULTISPECIES: DUF2892 domain-containing protein [Psychromonas]|uniref:YgaP family membrane protein n=1 Tax=Psychromonas TaxID=67572 RepID=UPI000420DCB4|nr:MULTISPECIES: DUF2892 domain-containing protein [Psychromonas]MBB1272646.1 DUF2892 domain-containing protein [Psychromonas sp. SR45-3]
MNKNIGNTDRTIRMVLGLALIIWGIISVNYWGAIGIVLIVTALVKTCPAYTILGVKTDKDEQ